MIRYLRLADVLEINKEHVGSSAVRDENVIASAVARPRATAFGQEQFPDLWHKAAALLQGLARSQGFIDGNKRTAWDACTTFLLINNVRLLRTSDAGAEGTILAISAGLLDVDAIAEWLTDLDSAKYAQRIFGGVVIFSNLPREDMSTVSNLYLENVEVRGPALLAPVGDTLLRDCLFATGPGAMSDMVVTVEEGSYLTGGFAIKDCMFVDCTLVGIGFALTPEGMGPLLDVRHPGQE